MVDNKQAVWSILLLKKSSSDGTGRSVSSQWNITCNIHVLTLSLLVVTLVVCWSHMRTVWTQTRTDKMSVLILIKAVLHWKYSWKNFLKKLILKSQQTTSNAWKELNCVFNKTCPPPRSSNQVCDNYCSNSLGGTLHASKFWLKFGKLCPSVTLKNVSQGHLHLINSSTYPNVLSRLIWLTLISPLFSVLEMLSAFYICCIKYIQVHFRRDILMEANKGSSLIWVHIVCNIVYLRISTDVRSRQQKSWLERKGLTSISWFLGQCHSRRKLDPDQKQYEPLKRYNHWILVLNP